MAISAERFAFGKNWSLFVQKQFSEERVASAKRRLLGSLRLDNLTGYTFLDIGCGSGLHSLAALQCGASRVVSFDFDPDSVEITRYLRAHEGHPLHWQVMQGSVLDESFMHSLPQADIVYSWGVLHHTGDTWKSLENSRIPLSPNGILFIALYSRTCYQNAQIVSGSPSPEQWLEIKQRYNKAGALGKMAMEWHYIWENELGGRSKSPLRIIKRIITLCDKIFMYRQNRGMEFWTDLRDWLGGWPMDFVKESEVVHFADGHLGLEFLDMITGEGNTEYIFRAKGANNYWDELLRHYTVEELRPSFTPNEGYCWVAPLSHLRDLANNKKMPRRSNLVVFEDGKPLSFPHAPRLTIQKAGEGRYNHWHEALYFSTSDNSNPNTNGRSYTIRYLPRS